MFGAISAGKHVVTANKALVAAYLPEIQSLLDEHPEVSFSYEAAVCGGIPIINTLQQVRGTAVANGRTTATAAASAIATAALH